MQGWNMALKDASLRFPDTAEGIDSLIKQRVQGSLKVCSAPAMHACMPGLAEQPQRHCRHRLLQYPNLVDA
jgi:hypothetical protein